MSAREKHLDFILSATSRMAQNSFLARGWAITLTTALLAVASNTEIKFAYALAGLPIVVFWVVDAYYLALERRYRLLFDAVRTEDGAMVDYNMDIRPYKSQQKMASAMFSPLTLFIYGSLLTLVVILVYAERVVQT